MIYGYARCSTDESRQDIDRQRRELRASGVAADSQIYWEYGSGTKQDRPELQKLLGLLQNGDTIITTEVSRLTRSTKHLCELLQVVQEKHIRLLIGSFSVDCRSEEIDPMTKGMLMMWGVFAEMERDLISQRVKSGMANAKAKGKPIGRPTRTTETSRLPSGDIIVCIYPGRLVSAKYLDFYGVRERQYIHTFDWHQKQGRENRKGNNSTMIAIIFWY